MSDITVLSEIENKILTVRGQNILIDRDVAELYGVETKKVNQAVSRNQDKFPSRYIFPLNSDEKNELVTNCDHLSTLKYSTAMPTAFTEKGLYMLATILKSPQATETTIAIVETFAKLRELGRVVTQLSNIEDEDKQKSLMQRGGEIFGEILDRSALETTADETTIELNLAVVKFKHTTKRSKKGQEKNNTLLLCRVYRKDIFYA